MRYVPRCCVAAGAGWSCLSPCLPPPPPHPTPPHHRRPKFRLPSSSCFRPPFSPLNVQVADAVIHVDSYVPVDVTARAKEIGGVPAGAVAPAAAVVPRLPDPATLRRSLHPAAFAVDAKCVARSVVRASPPPCAPGP